MQNWPQHFNGAALQACDELDGVKDRLISPVSACHAGLNLATATATPTATLSGQPVLCAGGVDTGDNFQSDAQIAGYSVTHRAVNSAARYQQNRLVGLCQQVRQDFNGPQCPQRPLRPLRPRRAGQPAHYPAILAAHSHKHGASQSTHLCALFRNCR